MWLAWLGIWLGISNTCGGMWSNWEGQNREIDEKRDEDCVKEWFQLDRVKFDRDAVRGREALGIGNCSISIRGGSELELA